MDLATLRAAALPLPELVRVVGVLLPPASGRDGRVSPLPDERTLRYYQSLGILDRPLRYDGRVAIYGYRHVLQVLCAKALQERGATLAQVQAALTGRSDAELERAVADAWPAAPALPPRPPPPAVPTVRPLVAVELAPGVVLTVDPAAVHDVAAAAHALSLALSPHLTSNGATP